MLAHRELDSWRVEADVIAQHHAEAHSKRGVEPAGIFSTWVLVAVAYAMPSEVAMCFVVLASNLPSSPIATWVLKRIIPSGGALIAVLRRVVWILRRTLDRVPLS